MNTQQYRTERFYDDHVKNPKWINNNITTGLCEMIRDIPNYHTLRVLELGVNTGISTLEFLRFCREVYAVDVIEKPEFISNTLPYKSRLTFINKRSEHYLANAQSELFDLVYVDDDHDHGHLMEILPLVYNIVKPDGYIAGHDYCYYGPEKYELAGVVKAVNLTFGYPHRVYSDTSWIFYKSNIHFQ
jgi:SAM-dependent methyltransferase